MILVEEERPHFQARAGGRRLRAVLEMRPAGIRMTMGEGGYDERGWAVEVMKNSDPFGGENGGENCESVFEGVGNGERIGTVWAAYDESEA